MLELIKFTRGGMNQDDSPDSENRQRNDYDEAFLFRTDGTATGEAGNGTNFESTVKLSGPRPAGINKCIGGTAFTHFGKAYSMIYNSQGYHLITELDHFTETETILYTNLTDSGGVDALRLNPARYITELQLIDGKFLPFINSFRQPCMINLERLKNKDYGVVRPEDFLLQKTQPMIEVRAVYGDDGSRSVNLFRQGLFQYISQYEFLDYELSAWSMISKRVVPVYEGTPAVGTDVTKNNHQVVYVNIGNDRVKVINVGARIGNYGWFTIKSIKRDNVLAITDEQIDVAAGIYEAYDPSTNTYGFAFYNDGNYNEIPPLETDLLNDAVPEESGTMEVINSNLIALSDLKEGKPRPDGKVEFVVSSYDAGLTSSEIENADALKVRWTTEAKQSSGLFKRNYEQVYLWFSGLPKAGDKIKSTVIDRNNKTSIQHEYPYTVLIAEQDNLLAMVQKYAKDIEYSSVRQQGDLVLLSFSLHKVNEHNEVRETFRDATVSLANIGDGSSTSKPAFKSNSSYQAALAYYDELGNPFPISTDDTYVFTTPSYAELKGRGIRVDWKITSAPPKGAKYYNILLSENNTHDKTLFVLASESTKSAADYIILYVNPLKKFNENNNASVVNYGFAKGDRVTLHYSETADNVRTWYDGVTVATKAVDVEVLDFAPIAEEEPSTVINYELKIRKPGSLNVADIAGKDLMIEIYTPRRRDSVNDSGDTDITTPFFEIGERYEIIDGAHVQTQGSLTEGDVYLKTRPYVGAVDPNTLYSVIVEDFNFSDYYTSNFYSYGRARAYFDTPEGIEMGAHIRYGEVYNKGSKVNGLTRFYLENIYGEGPGETTSAYGRIMKMTQRGGYLVVLQQSNNCHVPVHKTIWEDAEGQQQVAVSTRIFGPAQYNSAGNVGIGDSQTAYAKSANGTIYFIDPNNSMPMRDGYDGLKPIGGKMSKYFQETLYAASQAGKKVILYCNDFLNELVVTLETEGDVLVRIPLTPAAWETLEDYVVLSTAITLLSPSNKGDEVYDGLTGKAVYTSDPDESGNDSFTFQFNVDGVPVIKRACIMITAGDKTVDQFQFNDVTEAELNTVYTSNGVLISGNNVPVGYTLSGGQISINGGAFTSGGGLLYPDDLVVLRGTSSGSGSTAVNVVLSVGGQTDTFSITTEAVALPVPVTIDWNMTQDSAPYVNGIFVFSKGGVPIELITNVPVTSMNVGETLNINSFHYHEAFRWPDDASYTITIENAAEQVLHTFTGGSRDSSPIDLFDLELTETYYYIYATTTSSDATLAPLGFDINNTSGLSGGLIKVSCIDTTTGLTMLRVSEDNNMGAYNVKADAGTQDIAFQNLHSGPVTVRLRTVTATFDETFVVPAGTTVNKTGLTKAGVIIDIMP